MKRCILSKHPIGVWLTFQALDNMTHFPNTKWYNLLSKHQIVNDSLSKYQFVL